MSLDSIISRFYSEKPNADYKANPNLTEADLVKGKFFYYPHSAGLYVFIPPWHSDPRLAKLLNRKIRGKKCSALFYSFSQDVLSADAVLTVKYFDLIKNFVKKDIKKLKMEHGFSEVTIISLSMGAVIAMMVADNNPDINYLRLIVPGSCLASSMWNGSRTKGLRAKFQEQNISLADLQEAWAGLAPKNNISKLFAKEVVVELSRADEVIPYYYGRELTDTLVKSGVKTKLEENRFFGHYFTCLFFYLFPGLKS